MRSTLPLAALRIALRTLRPAGAVTPRSVVQIPTLRPLTTSQALWKKKASSKSVRKVRQERNDEDEDEADGAGEGESAGEIDVDAVLAKTEASMQKSVHWARGLIYEGVERARGRVSPALLDSVKVEVPDIPGSQSLNSVASITVKGNALYVNVWDHDQIKHVLSSIHSANLPGISPTQVDSTTLKIPIAKPTHEVRQDTLRQLAAQTETAKNSVRKARQDGLKHLGKRGEKDLPGMDQVKKLTERYSAELEDAIGQARREIEKAV